MSKNYDLREVQVRADALRVDDLMVVSGRTVTGVQDEGGGEVSVDFNDGSVEVYDADAMITVLV